MILTAHDRAYEAASAGPTVVDDYLRGIGAELVPPEKEMQVLEGSP